MVCLLAFKGALAPCMHICLMNVILKKDTIVISAKHLLWIFDVTELYFFGENNRVVGF